MKPRITTHEEVTPEVAAAIEGGVMEFNFTEGPMQGAAQVFASATTDEGDLVGGASGRRWGNYCELLYLWVQPAHRRHGLGSELLQAFEQLAASHGCKVFILDTFTFQAPEFYRKHGYAVAHEMPGFPQGNTKYTMRKVVGAA